MIERFVAAVAALRSAPAAQLMGSDGARLRADAADVVRLQIDCMQQELAPSQRAALHRLLEALEAEPPDAVEMSCEARRVSELLGLIGPGQAAGAPDRTDSPPAA